MSDHAGFQSKAGTFDVLEGENGAETQIFIVEDTPAHMVVRILETGRTCRLVKHVQ